MDTTNLSRFIGRTKLSLQEKSPEILLGVGLLGFAGTIYFAVKASMNTAPVIEQHQTEMDKIDSVDYADPEERTRLQATVYIKTGLQFMKLYAPAIGFGVLSVSSILASHGVMDRRQTSLIAAYNLLSEGYKSYRKRVVEELGEEVDNDFHLGLHDEKYTETETYPDGTTGKVKKTNKKHNPKSHSDYARFFDQTSRYWTGNPEQDLYFLKAQQNFANDRLHSQGYLFLNDVYEQLGFMPSQAGQVVGWLLPKNWKQGDGDGEVDFSIYNVNNGASREFVNGYNKSILLDFNVDGVILGKFEKI